MRELSAVEIEDVSGGIAPAVWGGVIGGISYYSVNLMTGQSSTFSGAAGAVAMGAVTGGYSAIGRSYVTGVGAVARDGMAGARGAISGASVSGAAREEEDS